MDREDTRLETRASYMKEVLEIIEQRGASLVQPLEAMSPDLLPAIRAATRAEWLPGEVGFEMARSLLGTVGRAETRAIYIDACLHSFRSGPLSPLFASAMTIFGPSPHLVARFIPSAWNAVWRGCGELVVEEARPGVVRIRHTRLPPEAAFDAFHDVCAACLESVIVGCKRSGHGLVERRNGRDPIGYLLQWEER